MGGQHSWTPPEQKHDDQHHMYAATLNLASASTLGTAGLRLPAVTHNAMKCELQQQLLCWRTSTALVTREVHAAAL